MQYFLDKIRIYIFFCFNRDISLVQNQFDITYNDLVRLKRDLEEDLLQLEKLELVLNLLNYKIYEIQYNFMTTIDGLKNRRKNIEASSGKESQIALALIELDKELAEHENTHDSSFQVAKEEKLVISLTESSSERR